MYCCEPGTSVGGAGAVSGLLAGRKGFDANAGNWLPPPPLLLLLLAGAIGFLLKVSRGEIQPILYLVPGLCGDKGKKRTLRTFVGLWQLSWLM